MSETEPERGLDEAAVREIERRAEAAVAATPLPDEDAFAAAVEAQLARLAGRPSQLGKARATVLAMAQVGLTIPSQEAVFALPDVVSRRVYYDKGKGWFHDPLFREVLETTRRLYRKWAAGAAAREATAEFAEKEATLRRAEWDMSREMTRVALEMVKAPLHETEVSDDGRTIIVKPARWSLDTVPRLADAASRLGRLSTGLAAGGRQEVDIALHEALPPGITPEQAEQVKILVARMLATADAPGDDEEGDDDE